jgi:hypothetical protein
VLHRAISSVFRACAAAISSIVSNGKWQAIAIRDDALLISAGIVIVGGMSSRSTGRREIDSPLITLRLERSNSRATVCRGSRRDLRIGVFCRFLDDRGG